jgi:hypothetical protein
MRGDKEFFVDCLSHAIKHLIDAPWDNDEDFDTHLGHAACNIAFILWARRRGKISPEDYQNAAAVLGAGSEKQKAGECKARSPSVAAPGHRDDCSRWRPADYPGLRESL